MTLKSIHVLIGLALVVALAGCGGDDEPKAVPGTFESEDYPFAFDYPEDWSFSDSPEFEYGAGNAERSVAVQLAPPQNQITVSEYRLSRALAEGENAPAKEIDNVVESLADQTGGRAGKGKEVLFSGAPGYEYTLRFRDSSGTRLRSRLIYLFKGQSEYEINCQSDRKGRDQVDAACDQVLDSLEIPGDGN